MSFPGYTNVIPAQAGIQGPPVEYALHGEAKAPRRRHGKPQRRRGHVTYQWVEVFPPGAPLLDEPRLPCPLPFLQLLLPGYGGITSSVVPDQVGDRVVYLVFPGKGTHQVIPMLVKPSLPARRSRRYRGCRFSCRRGCRRSAVSWARSRSMLEWLLPRQAPPCPSGFPPLRDIGYVAAFMKHRT